MDKDTHARETQLHATSIFTKRPERAQVINRDTAEVREGLGCIYEQDDQRLSIDMPVAIGGSDAAPPPGHFGRATVCRCLAIGIKMTAVQENLQLGKVCVGIEQDWDNRGLLAICKAQTRYRVKPGSQSTSRPQTAMRTSGLRLQVR